MSSLADQFARLLFALPVLAAPWLLGGVKESTEFYATLLVCFAVFVWLVSEFAARHDGKRSISNGRIPSATWPIVLGIGLGLLQSTSLPRGVARVLAPHTVELREELLADPDHQRAASAAAAAVRPAPRITYELSLRPGETTHQTAMLVLALACFILAGRLLRSERAIMTAMTVVAVNAATLACFGMLQSLTWNGRLFWIGRELSIGAPFATFVNRNNAAGYLNLGLAAAVVVAVWKLRGSPSGHATSADSAAPSANVSPSGVGKSVAAERARGDHARHHGTRRDRHDGEHQPGHQRGDQPGHQRGQRRGRGHRQRKATEPLDPLTVAAIGLAALILAGIMSSLSRGGTLAAVTALLIALPLATVGRRNSQPMLLGGALIAGALLVGWVGRWDLLSERLESLGDEQAVMSDGRLPNWHDAIQAVPDFWSTGSGLGTYSDIYRIYQERFDETWYKHAENQFLQSLVEGGIPALSLLVLAIVLVAASAWRLVRGSSSLSVALGVGGIACLAGQFVSGSFDFGMYHSAQMMLLASFCGVVAFADASPEIAASAVQPASTIQAPTIQATRPVPTIVIFLVLAVGLPTAVTRMRSLDQSARRLEATEFDESPGAASTAQLTELASQLRPAAGMAPRDAKLQQRLARVYEALYRAELLERLRTGADATKPLDQLWRLTSTVELHRRVFSQADDQHAITKVRGTELINTTLALAWNQWLAARAACPIEPNVHLRLARLAWIAGDASDDVRHLQRVERLAGSDAMSHVDGGHLDLNAGRIEDASRRWRRAIELTDKALIPVLPRADWGGMTMQTVVDDVLPADANLLIRLATNDKAQDKAWRAALLARATKVLTATAERTSEAESTGGESTESADATDKFAKVTEQAEMLYQLGRVYQLQGQPDEAMQRMSEAIELRSRNIEWRYNYGILLLQSGQKETAREQLSWCARRDARDPRFRQALERLHNVK